MFWLVDSLFIFKNFSLRCDTFMTFKLRQTNWHILVYFNVKTWENIKCLIISSGFKRYVQSRKSSNILYRHVTSSKPRKQINRNYDIVFSVKETNRVTGWGILMTADFRWRWFNKMKQSRLLTLFALYYTRSFRSIQTISCRNL